MPQFFDVESRVSQPSSKHRLVGEGHAVVIMIAGEIDPATASDAISHAVAAMVGHGCQQPPTGPEYLTGSTKFADGIGQIPERVDGQDEIRRCWLKISGRLERVG